MHVSEAGWVGDDCIGYEGSSSYRIVLDAGIPTSLKHFRDHGPLFPNVTLAHTFHARDDARILDHVGHELFWIAANGKEFQPSFCDEVLEDIVCC